MISIFVDVPLRGDKTMLLRTIDQKRRSTKVRWYFQFTVVEVLDTLCGTMLVPITLIVRPATGKDITMDLKPGKAWAGQRKRVTDILTRTVRARNLVVSEKNRKDKAKATTGKTKK